MEAIDTVMSDEQILIAYESPVPPEETAVYWSEEEAQRLMMEHRKRIAQAQAEITFPKGEKQGIDKGRKEVVKDFETVLDAPEDYQRAMFFDVLNGWQAKLKE